MKSLRMGKPTDQEVIHHPLYLIIELLLVVSPEEMAESPVTSDLCGLATIHWDDDDPRMKLML